MAQFPGPGAPGEYKFATLASASAVSISTGTSKTPTGCSITLAPGQWEVWGVVDFQFQATTSYTALLAGVSTAQDTMGAADTFAALVSAANVPTAAADMALPTPHQILQLSAPTTVYLVAKATFSASTMKAYGSIFARRIR